MADAEAPNNPLPILIKRKPEWKRYFASGWKWGVQGDIEGFVIRGFGE